ncbi:MAG: hypothetical protein LBK52_01770, partial [Deltaproteobacteria bacterium]|nr:hypothetical protein [Deltaproteobacteria bacterium]
PAASGPGRLSSADSVFFTLYQTHFFPGFILKVSRGDPASLILTGLPGFRNWTRFPICDNFIWQTAFVLVL